MLFCLKLGLKGVFALLVVASLGALSLTHAQANSDKPINVVIPFAPGGGTDVLTRMVMPKVADKLGVTAVIENRPGAAGAIGAQFVARANPDGKTLLVGSVSEIGINPPIALSVILWLSQPWQRRPWCWWCIHPHKSRWPQILLGWQKTTQERLILVQQVPVRVPTWRPSCLFLRPKLN